MTKENAKELQVDLAKDALVLLTLHGEMDVRSHRECIELIGEAWDILRRSSGSRWPCLKKSRYRSELGRAMYCWRRNCP